MRIVHWLNFTRAISGLYNYTYALHKASLELGYDSHICYWDSQLKNGAKLTFPMPNIGEITASPWSVKDGAINITHDQLPLFPLDNWVTEMHATPEYVAREFDPLSTALYKLGRAKMVFTRFLSHVPYWKAFTDKPIHVIPPGVDLHHWKPEGKKQEFTRPMVLWADTWREPVKNPLNLLYAMKIANQQMPGLALKLVAIPSEKVQMLAYLCGRMGLDSAIEWPIETMVKNIDELYRGAEVLYTDTPEEGSNVSWEAEACGLPVVHRKDTPEQIAAAILEQINKHERPVKARDIRDTVKAMVSTLEAL